VGKDLKMNSLKEEMPA